MEQDERRANPDRDENGGQEPAEKEADSGSAVDDVRDQLERSGERLQEGNKLHLPGDAELPVRSIAAIVIFVTVFVVVYLLSWVALGTIGLAIGVLAGLAAGALAVKLYADHAAGS